MKPFDLEKAKAGAPLCTRDGSKARIVVLMQITIDSLLLLYLKAIMAKNIPLLLLKKDDFLMGKQTPQKIYSWWEKRKKDG